MELFASKRAEDLTLFGSIADTVDNTSKINANTLSIATNHSDILAAQASIAANAADISANRMVSCTSTTRPATGLFLGKRIYETDTQASGHWDGSAWVMTDSRYVPYTPTWTASAGTPALGTGGYLLGRYARNGKRCTVYIELYLGTPGANGGTAGSAWYFALPFNGIIGSSTEPTYQNHANVNAGTGGVWAPAFAYMPDATKIALYATTSATSTAMQAIGGGATIAGVTITQAARVRAYFSYAMA